MTTNNVGERQKTKHDARLLYSTIVGIPPLLGSLCFAVHMHNLHAQICVKIAAMLTVHVIQQSLQSIVAGPIFTALPAVVLSAYLIVGEAKVHAVLGALVAPKHRGCRKLAVAHFAHMLSLKVDTFAMELRHRLAVFDQSPANAALQ